MRDHSDVTPPCKMLRRSDSPENKHSDTTGNSRAKAVHAHRARDRDGGEKKKNGYILNILPNAISRCLYSSSRTLDTSPVFLEIGSSHYQRFSSKTREKAAHEPLKTASLGGCNAFISLTQEEVSVLDHNTRVFFNCVEHYQSVDKKHPWSNVDVCVQSTSCVAGTSNSPHENSHNHSALQSSNSHSNPSKPSDTVSCFEDNW